MPPILPILGPLGVAPGPPVPNAYGSLGQIWGGQGHLHAGRVRDGVVMGLGKEYIAGGSCKNVRVPQACSLPHLYQCGLRGSPDQDPATQ